MPTLTLKELTIMSNAAPGRVRTVVKVGRNTPRVLYVPAIDVHGNFDETEYNTLCDKLRGLFASLYPSVRFIEVSRG